jgi:hypothetical protein
LGGLSRDVNVAANAFHGVIRDEEAVAFAMHVQAPSGVFAAEPSGYEMSRPDLQQVAALLQAVERSLYFLARRPTRSQFANQLFEGSSRVGKARDVIEKGGVRHCPNYKGLPVLRKFL